MTREARIFFLTQIAEAFEGNHMDTEAEAIREAIYDTGIIDTLRKERDAAIEAMKQPDIIRCKDCKKNPSWEWVGCPMTGKNTRKPDDFCSYAERRV